MGASRKYCGAADIGTTTLELSILKEDGTVLASRREWNTQKKYGADVVTRLAGGAGGGWKRVSKTLVSQLQNGFSVLCREAGIVPEEMDRIALSGNTVMLHYAAGLNPTGLGTAPFQGESLFGMEKTDSRNGIRIYFAPCIGAYAGGDLVSGILACGLKNGPGNVLLADIGTNGEIAVWNGKQLLVCSTSAGPAFEGIGIGCGMPALPGAVRRIAWSREAGFRYEVIGNGKPEGICGSGLMDLVAALLQSGALEKSGRWNRESAVFRECGFENTGGSGIRLPGTELEISQKEIRQLQLAKGAIRAGMEMLLRKSGVRPDGLDRVILSGGFAEYTDPVSVLRIGLLPEGTGSRLCLDGNTSLRGAVLLAMFAEARLEAEETAAEARIVGLSGNREFNELFIEYLPF